MPEEDGQPLAKWMPMLCSDLRGQKNEWDYARGKVWHLYTFKPGDRSTGEMLLHSPLWAWKIRNLSVLPNDYLIFQLGDQICLLDPFKKILAVVTHGYRPLAVLNDERGEQLFAADREAAAGSIRSPQ
jgi:hypothetical protein